MDPSKPRYAPAHFDRHDMNSLNEETDRLRPTLCAMTRAYNTTKKELEGMKEAAGFYNKALPFLRLPREVRDQIYKYTLIAPSNLKPEPRPLHLLHLEPLSWKPTTPGLCLVNKQIHSEAVDILYGRNIFCFRAPGELVRFEERIGPDNWDLIHSLEILLTEVASTNSSAPDPDLIAPCDWLGVPTHWSKALMKSHLKEVDEMMVTVVEMDSSEVNLVTVSPVLQHAIEDVLHRSLNRDLKRRLTLKGFCLSERDKFPSDWDVRVKQWEGSEDDSDDERGYYGIVD
jgi:hypothetical protein